MTERRKTKVPTDLLFWMVVAIIVFPIVGYIIGRDGGLEYRCKKDCGGSVHHYEAGECICAGPDDTFYRAPGWEKRE